MYSDKFTKHNKKMGCQGFVVCIKLKHSKSFKQENLIINSAFGEYKGNILMVYL